MNKTNIDYAHYTWNPCTGCRHACPYCYAARINKRFGDGKFTPTFHRERLGEPLTVKKPSKIFVGSMADLFGDWNWAVGTWEFSPAEVMADIFETVDQCPQHTFIFLTKNPRGMQGIKFPDNCWCGTSVENQEKANQRIPDLLEVNCKTLFVSYEPALGEIDLSELPGYWHPGCTTHDALLGRLVHHDDDMRWTSDRKIDWLVIGAQTGPGAVPPNPEWITGAIDQCRGAGVPIFVKDNVKMHTAIREYPGREQER